MYEKYNIFPIDLSTVKYTADASVEVCVCVCLYNLRYVFFFIYSRWVCFCFFSDDHIDDKFYFLGVEKLEIRWCMVISSAIPYYYPFCHGLDQITDVFQSLFELVTSV